MKSGYRKYLSIAVSAIIILSISLYTFQRWQRHHLFCEVIKVGMSEAEVLTIMGYAGTFGIGRYESFVDTEDITLEVQPGSSFKTSLIYGIRGLELHFTAGLLANALERYRLEDGIYELCNN